MLAAEEPSDYDYKILDELMTTSAQAEADLTQKIGGTDTFSAVNVFQRSVARDDKKKTTIKSLADIEKRSSQANAALPSDRSHHSNAPLSSFSRRELVEESKRRARQNMLQHVQAVTVDEVRIQGQKEKEDIVRKFENEISSLRNDRDEARMAATESLGQISAMAEEISSLKYTTELLRKKMQRMAEREVDNQRKLAVFSHIEPIFEKLSEEFQFAAPEQILKRIEKLKESQVEIYNQYAEAVESKSELEKRMERVKRDTEGRLQKQLNEAFDARTRAERKLNEAESRITELQSQVKRLSDMRETYLTVHSSIMDLWNKWSSEAASRAGASMLLDEPDMNNPLHIIVALHNLVIEFTPSKAGESFRELSAVTNRYWARYFADDANLKGKPKAILDRMAALLDTRTADVERTNKAVVALQDQIKELHDKIKRGEVQKRQLAAEAELLRSGGRVNSRASLVTADGERPLSRSSVVSRRATSAARQDVQPLSAEKKSASHSSGVQLSPHPPSGHQGANRPMTTESAKSFFLTQTLRDR